MNISQNRKFLKMKRALLILVANKVLYPGFTVYTGTAYSIVVGTKRAGNLGIVDLAQGHAHLLQEAH